MSTRTTAIDAVRSAKPKADIAYFYCSFINTESLEESVILGSLLSQLHQFTETSIEKLEPLYKASGGQIKSPSQPNRLDSKRLIEPIAEQICDAQDVYLFIDGINECEDPELVVSSLGKIIKLCPEVPIHIFISSIDEKGIGIYLEAFPDLRVIRVRQGLLHEDIGLLIRSSLESNQRLRRYGKDLKSEIEWALTQGAHGM